MINKEFDDIEEENTYENINFSSMRDKIRVSDVTFINCTFDQNNFKNSEWLDCTFSGINFSNFNFENSVLYRTEFKNCNLLGIDFSGNTWKDNTIENSRADYATFNSSKLTNTHIRNSNFNETYFREVAFQKGFVAKDRVVNALSREEFKSLIENNIKLRK